MIGNGHVTRVIVVGGGIAGLTAAYYLRRAGAEVTVVEARRVGAGASWGNAGWVTPAQAGPLPEPGLVGYGLRSLVDPASALYFDPRQLVRMAPWLLRFARRCNQRDHRSGRVALASLASRCDALLDAMVADGIELELNRAPLLVAAMERANAETFLSSLEPLAPLGFRVPTALLGPEQMLALEPALSDAVRAGFVIEHHCTVQPAAMVTALRDRLGELGVEILEGTELREVDVEGPRVAAVRTSGGRHRCDSVVLATGAWLAELAPLFGGLRLPIAAGKGYSFEVRPHRMPRHALMLLEPHVGCSPAG